MRLLARGSTNKQIATALSVSERAIKAHVSILLEKFGVRNRAALIANVLSGPQAGASAAVEYAVYDSAPFIVQVLHGPEHHYAYVNRRFEEVTGLSRARLIGRTVRDVFPAMREEYIATLDRAFATGLPLTYENVPGRWRADDGSERQSLFDQFYQPIRSVSGAVIALLLIGATTPS
jgi:PAS domain S-box-containing protein